MLVSVPLGCGLGLGLLTLSAHAMTSDLFRLPVVVEPGTWMRAVGTVVAAAAALILLARRWVARLDLVDVLKSRE